MSPFWFNVQSYTCLLFIFYFFFKKHAFTSSTPVYIDCEFTSIWMFNNFLQIKTEYATFIKMENRLLLPVAMVLATFAGKILLIILYLIYYYMHWDMFSYRKRHDRISEKNFAMLTVLTLVNSYVYEK